MVVNKKIKKIRLSDKKDIPHRLHDTNIRNLETKFRSKKTKKNENKRSHNNC